MTSFERPSPDIDKIVAAWAAWQAQADEVLPGRTIADLKIGGVDRVLTAVVQDNPDLAPIAEAWSAWERGRVGPRETLDALTAAGFADLVEALSTPA